jgi:predicted Zn-dependent protease
MGRSARLSHRDIRSRSTHEDRGGVGTHERNVEGAVDACANRVSVLPRAMIPGDLAERANQPPDISPKAQVLGKVDYREPSRTSMWSRWPVRWLFLFLGRARPRAGRCHIVSRVGAGAGAIQRRPGASFLVGSLPSQFTCHRPALMSITTRHVTHALAALLLASPFLVSCATNPVSGDRELSLLSEQREIEIGREVDAQVRLEMGVYESDTIQQYVNRVGQQIALGSDRPDLPWHFTVIDVPTVNAFALPGGYIYLTRGIMAYLQDEAELAGVLGHEVGHVAARHAAQAYTRSTGTRLGLAISSIFLHEVRPYRQVAATGLGLLFLEYGHNDELQADRLGAEYAAQSGWDPEGVADMLRTLARLDEIEGPDGLPNWTATHPEPGERLDEITSVVGRLARTRGELVRSKAAYLNHVDGLVYGNDPQEGIVRGREFVHPGLRFAITYPYGWRITNGKTRVVAGPAYSEVSMILQQAPVGPGDLGTVAVSSMTRAGFREVRGSSTHINGLPAHLGTYTRTIERLGRVSVRAAHIAHEGRTYLVAGVAPLAQFAANDQTFDATIKTFRPLSIEAAERVEPMRLAIHWVRAGDSWESLAGLAESDAITAKELALVNGFAPGTAPVPGTRIKVVRAGAHGT